MGGIVKLARRLLGLALYRLIGPARDDSPVQPARITILAAHALYDEYDCDRDARR